jgi:hypothetical protein
VAEAPNQEEQEIAVITLESEDGHSYDCEMLDRFVFEDNEYALLLKIAEEGADEELEEEDQTLVIMRFFHRGNDFVFQTIDSDEEFEKVRAFVEEKVESERAAMEAGQ